MKEDDKDKRTPLLHVRTTGQRDTSPQRVVVIQTNTPASRDAKAGSTKSVCVAGASAGGDLGDKPIKRIGAADLEKMLGAEAAAALERMRLPR